MARRLCEAGADLEWCPPGASLSGFTALHSAISSDKLEFVQCLVKAGANVEHSSKPDNRPLVLAVMRGNPAVVQCLIDGGADVKRPCQPGKHDLIPMAVASGNLEILQILVAAGGFFSTDPDAAEHSPLLMAATLGNESIVRWLLESGVVDDRQLHDPFILSIAAEKGHTGVVECLLKAGARAAGDKQPNERPTSLVLAAENGHAEVVQLLVSAGADVERVDTWNLVEFTPLTIAIRMGHLPVVKCLVEAHADVHRPAPGSYTTPILLAWQFRHLEIAKFLFSMGAHDSLVKVTPKNP